MALGAQLQALRKAKGLGLREAARASGVSASTLSRTERNIGTPDTIIMSKLAEFYGVTFESLLDVYKPTQAQTDAFLIGHGYKLDELQREINALIDELRTTAQAILAERAGNG